ncbi:hypothetical protein BJF79_13710 [Actinomadura sp. CNU-125]|uniref:RNA ligase n=1 Tax=Actinomadura sp. CNU-125 TaxID=1904961 RepID=UPI000966CB37|nr:RNA ligase [Actinomadura sp. CNU-125]OLT24393.1 hypothetical protein BJF79_13710 [Actinomadura sp. CNU-125]
MTLHITDLLDDDALTHAIDAGHVRAQHHPTLPLTIYNYTERCQYERAWTFVTRTCRGLIVGDDGTVVARPWAKFFNHGEPEAGTLDLDARVEVVDKIDGSLGILYPTGDGFAVATRGSFTSDQAVHATQLLRERYGEFEPPPGVTVLFEVVYPGNRIVVDYGGLDDLVLLGAVDIATGWTYAPFAVPDWPGPCAQTFEADTLADALALPPRPGAEGVVVRVEGGTMVKLKQAAYVELHRIVTGLNARVVWEALGSGRTVADICEPLPDELHAWVGDVADRLMGELRRIEYSARARHEVILQGLATPVDRKEYAKAAIQSEHRAWLFMLLDGKDPAAKIWRTCVRRVRSGRSSSPRTWRDDRADRPRDPLRGVLLAGRPRTRALPHHPRGVARRRPLRRPEPARLRARCRRRVGLRVRPIRAHRRVESDPPVRPRRGAQPREAGGDPGQGRWPDGRAVACRGGPMSDLNDLLATTGCRAAAIALAACFDGNDENAAARLAPLDAGQLKATEDAAVALSLHAHRARRNIENGEGRG